MRTFLLLTIVALLLTSQSEAQLPGATNATPVKGAFLVSVDDHCTIFVNGTQVYHGDIGKSRSPETQLKAGDRVVVRLTNDVGPRQFLLVFTTTDGKSVVSFKNQDYRIVPAVGLSDFSSEQFKNWKAPKAQKHKPELPVKNYSESVWGDLDRCILACIVTPQMFSQVPK
jgi:hypothetical protein